MRCLPSETSHQAMAKGSGALTLQKPYLYSCSRGGEYRYPMPLPPLEKTLWAKVRLILLKTVDEDPDPNQTKKQKCLIIKANVGNCQIRHI